MKNHLRIWRRLAVMKLVTALVLTFVSSGRSIADTSGPAPTPPNHIPLDQIGAVAGKQYSGDGLSVVATDGGALLRCVFQRLEGEATRDGLWLSSTVPDQTNDRFQVKAMAVDEKSLPDLGDVSTDGQTVRFSRPGLVEEYSVSMDGVRQDFLVLEKPGVASVPASRLVSSLAPPWDGELRVELSVTGAKVEQTATTARLMLENSGRKIAYSRLKVTDAKGKELPARFEAASNSALRTLPSEFAMAVVVDDSEAAYPIRIDPTFSDANWISMGGLPGANDLVYTVVADGAGNIYIGGSFSIVGDTFANCIAKWNGSSWCALGSGLNATVKALAVSGSDIYAGGIFAGGIAKWNGTNWSALGSGMNADVYALAVSGGDVYAGGVFTMAGGRSANRIAKWNGSSWSAMGSGMNSNVWALVVSGSDVYAGGVFTTAGGSLASYVAKWNGSSWSALGSGMNSHVYALAVSGSDVYAGGPVHDGGRDVGQSDFQMEREQLECIGAGAI